MGIFGAVRVYPNPRAVYIDVPITADNERIIRLARSLAARHEGDKCIALVPGKHRRAGRAGNGFCTNIHTLPADDPGKVSGDVSKDFYLHIVGFPGIGTIHRRVVDGHGVCRSIVVKAVTFCACICCCKCSSMACSRVGRPGQSQGAGQGSSIGRVLGLTILGKGCSSIDSQSRKCKKSDRGKRDHDQRLPALLWMRIHDTSFTNNH